MAAERPTDPCERCIYDALTDAGVLFLTERETPAGLDFFLPAYDVYLEVKRFHSERIAGQMARAPNVIAIQGADAVNYFANLIRRGQVAPGPSTSS